ncbi:hypothetical protein PFISCL1PPCAC_7450, partial [Pristionchus fissidentatus]
IFELYRHGENEYWITEANVTADERKILIKGFHYLNFVHHCVPNTEGALYYSEKIREILSAQVMFRIYIYPELYQIIEKAGSTQQKEKRYDLLLTINGYESLARDFVEHFYERMKEQNKTPTPLDGPSDHTWLKEPI